MPHPRSATRWPARMLGLAALSVLALLLTAGRAYAVPFSNTGAITINDATADGSPKASTPEPSNIAISGVTGPVTKVTATINGFAHGCPTDTGMLLVGPLGQQSVLMSYIGDCTHNVPGPARADINLTFDDAAGSNVPCLVTAGPGGTPSSTMNLSGGIYKPTNGPPKGSTGSCAFAEGATPINFAVGSPVGPVSPVGGYPTGLAAFNGVDPNGTWRLYAVDEWKGDGGRISGGWTLNLTVAAPTVTAPAISGTPQVGATLSAVSGQITNGGAASWAWFRCDGSGNVCGSSPVGTGSTYTPVAADKGSTLKLTETVANSGGNNSASSAPTAIVADANNVQVPNLTKAVLATTATKSKQKVLQQGGVLASLTSSIDGNLVATGTVSVPKLAKVYKFKAVTAKVVANNRTTVALKLPSAGLKAVKKALAKHKKLKAKVTLKVTTASGAVTTVTKTISLAK